MMQQNTTYLREIAKIKRTPSRPAYANKIYAALEKEGVCSRDEMVKRDVAEINSALCSVERMMETYGTKKEIMTELDAQHERLSMHLQERAS